MAVPEVEGSETQIVTDAGCSAIVQVFHQLRVSLDEATLTALADTYSQGVTGKSIPRWASSSTGLLTLSVTAQIQALTAPLH